MSRILYDFRIGETRVNKHGCVMKLVKYNNYSNIVVEFQDKYRARVKTSYQCFKKNETKNPFYKSVFNIGYIGITSAMNNGILKKSYTVWVSMLGRCYNKKDKLYYRYGERGVIVSLEWHCYATFEKWYDENYYEIENEEINLDKDILNKNNKEYNPNCCIFSPKTINNLFTKSNKIRGNLPIGVTYRKDINKYHSQCSTKDKRIHLGQFDTPEEAFQAYKEFKESHIKQVADEYKSKIPQKLYDAMYAYQVEITD